MTIFDEVAREAAARALIGSKRAWEVTAERARAFKREQATDALDAALDALPPRTRAFLALAGCSDEELVERIEGAIRDHDLWRAFDADARVALPAWLAEAALTALGLPVVEQEDTKP